MVIVFPFTPIFLPNSVWVNPNSFLIFLMRSFILSPLSYICDYKTKNSQSQ
nr:MAG TPA: hypothetical protein [Caudoviricetes sp.]